MGKYLVESYEQALRENVALREENERLTAANKARAEYLTTRRAGNDVDSYVNLAETKIEELRAQLAEAQEELAQWRATGESVTRNEHDLSARLASVERERDEIMAMAERRDGELQARLAEAETQNRVMWDVASDREARLAEAKALLREARGEIAWAPSIKPVVARIDAFLATASPAPRSSE